MNYFLELLESFDQLKKRKYKLKLVEQTGEDPEAESKAMQALQQAKGYSSSNPLKIGTDLQLFFVETRKNNQPGGVTGKGHFGTKGIMQVALTDPNLSYIAKPNLVQAYIDYFREEEEKAQEKEDEQVLQIQQPVSPVQPQLENISSNFQKILQRGIDTGDRFFTASDVANWETPNEMGQFGLLRSRFVEGRVSLAAKLENTYGLKEVNGTFVRGDPLTIKQKEALTDIIEEFSDNLNKLHADPASVTEDQIDWMASHVKLDSAGVWFYDARVLPEGAVIEWSGGGASHANILLQSVKAWNKRLLDYQEEEDPEGDKKLTPIPEKDFLPRSAKGSANDVTGKLPERLIIGFTKFVVGFRSNNEALKEEAKQFILDEIVKLNERFTSAFQFIRAFKKDETIGTYETVDLLNQFQEMLDLFGIEGEEADEQNFLVQEVLTRLVLMEKDARLRRSPSEVLPGNDQGIGQKSDVDEMYDSPEQLLDTLMNNYNMTRKQASKLVQINKDGRGFLSIALKTYKTGNTGVKTGQLRATTLLGSYSDVNSQALITEARSQLGINSQDIKTVKAFSEKLIQEADTITNAFKKIKAPGISADEASRILKSTVKSSLINRGVYGDLLNSENLDAIEDDMDARKRLGNKIARKHIFRKMVEPIANEEGKKAKPFDLKDDVLRKSLAMTAAMTGMAADEVALEYRDYESTMSYLLSNNALQGEVLKGLVDGTKTLQISKNSELTVWVGETLPDGTFKRQMSIGLEKGGKTFEFVVHMYSDYVKEKAYKTKPKQKPTNEGILEYLLNNQRILEYLIPRRNSLGTLVNL